MNSNNYFDEVLKTIPADVKRYVELQGDIAVHLSDVLKDRNLSVKQAADIIEISDAYLYKILTGQANITLNMIARIETKLNVKLITV